MSAILVVDDSKVMRDMVVACLRAIAGTTYTHASTGLEAIERLSLAHFDLMVLDLNMPDVGGIEVLEFVRRQDRLRALPVLIVTTRVPSASAASAAFSHSTQSDARKSWPAGVSSVSTSSPCGP